MNTAHREHTLDLLEDLRALVVAGRGGDAAQVAAMITEDLATNARDLLMMSTALAAGRCGDPEAETEELRGLMAHMALVLESLDEALRGQHVRPMGVR